MPGPMSAPNGNYSLTVKPRNGGEIVKSGKTALKRGTIEHKTKTDEVARIRRSMSSARRREQEES